MLLFSRACLFKSSKTSDCDVVGELERLSLLSTPLAEEDENDKLQTGKREKCSLVMDTVRGRSMFRNIPDLNEALSGKTDRCNKFSTHPFCDWQQSVIPLHEAGEHP